MIRAIGDEAEEVAFRDYITNLKDTSIVVDRYTISMISNRFNRDVFFLDASTRIPYREGGTDHIKKRKTIILLWTGGIHYEVVGRLLPGNRIEREFSPDDPLIVRIRTFLCHPERVASEYPRLVPYLPKEYRHKIGMRSRSRGSRSEESYSESEYEESTEDEESDDISYSESDSEKKDSSRQSKYSRRSGSSRRPSRRRYQKSPSRFQEHHHKKHRHRSQESSYESSPGRENGVHSVLNRCSIPEHDAEYKQSSTYEEEHISALPKVRRPSLKKEVVNSPVKEKKKHKHEKHRKRERKERKGFG